ncbi:hypothetical protein San01_60470 [Streptomyces angustmyceticus]|uniref:Uncharacterized protein n=1 Tax=Streptomyces angustmyceticus TaxID=285578 RepID=A0A5J4LPZ1_9ACTN|nr:hypothetical protein San01_60470 [Streptomyces angustmyceticus]
MLARDAPQAEDEGQGGWTGAEDHATVPDGAPLGLAGCGWHVCLAERLDVTRTVPVPAWGYVMHHRDATGSIAGR